MNPSSSQGENWAMALSHNALGNMLAYLTNALERDSIVASLE